MSTTIRLGLKFTSTTFSAEAEVSAIRPGKNELDVILTPSDGHSWEEKNWNLEHAQWGFDRDEYKEIPFNNVNISVI